MIDCNSCGRHLLDQVEPCPFCNKTPQGISGKIKVIGASATAFFMAACYGIAPDYMKETGLEDTGSFDTEESESNQDADNIIAPKNSNNVKPFITPKQNEKCDDGLDNDGNNLIDALDPACK
jgi:hypothetical protein